MKKTVKVYVHQRLAGFMRGELFACGSDISDVKNHPPCRVIHEQEIEVEAMDASELDLLEIEALEAAIIQERCESQHKVNLLLDRISQLKAIGHEVAA